MASSKGSSLEQRLSSLFGRRNLVVLLHMILFLSTGVWDTMGKQYAKYVGFGEWQSLMPSFVLYTGMSLVVIVQRKESEGKLPHKTAGILAFVDVCSNVACVIGMIWAGSGVFQVVYSANILFCALLSRIFLRKKLILVQWLALIGIVSGLAISSIHSSGNSEDDGQGWRVFLGVLVTLAGTLGYAIIYVVNEVVMKRAGGPAPAQMCTWVGRYGMIMCTSYIFLYTLPHWDTVVEEPMKRVNGNPYLAFFLYISLVGSAFGHNYAYYWLLNEVGSVSAAILNALRAVLVFTLSALLYCSRQQSQCYSSAKVVASVVVYSLVGKSVDEKQARKLKEGDERAFVA